ncbi:glycosyl hydrolase [Pontibacter sp. G13]|uniref:glycosyl hydrolase n=1 Tax=Pontibacter sp. G13 TaxID=3074898 RepID=UPI00288BDA18|nr:glycosyl hydrolase [Pontibacter sp. G13]WNJ18237.1 glycosyl hydrolase [Pontibacter sp. G13]
MSKKTLLIVWSAVSVLLLCIPVSAWLSISQWWSRSSDSRLPLVVEDSMRVGIPAKAVPDSLGEGDDIWMNKGLQLEGFRTPDVVYRPWIKWYWPGANVESSDLLMQMQLIHDRGFGGAEIYMTTEGYIASDDFEEAGQSVGGNPGFEQKLLQVFQEAYKRNIHLDLHVGVGSPSGGPHVPLHQGVKTLVVGEAHVFGGKTVEIPLPEPHIPISYPLWGWAEPNIHPRPVNVLNFFPNQHQPLVVLAAKATSHERSNIPWELTDVIELDPDSIFHISSQVSPEGIVKWEAPSGEWEILAFYEMPAGLSPWFGEYDPPGYVVDLLDSVAVLSHHDHWLKEWPVLDEFRVTSLRGIAHDQTKIGADLLWANGFSDAFKKRRGYELTPYFPALMMPGGSNYFLNGSGVNRTALFSVTEADERIRYDFQKTISDLYLAHFVQPTEHWALDRNLMVKSQPFGMDIDLIEAAGQSRIPEASQAFAGGSDLGVKLVSSGAHLGGRELVSAEALSFLGQTGKYAPLSWKVAVDKLFTAGINHIVLDGLSYGYSDKRFGARGWQPRSSDPSVFPMGGTDLSPNNPFWEEIDEFTKYLSRCQWGLRAGESQVDVCVYYPFLGFPTDYGKVSGSEEFFLNGQHEELSGNLHPVPDPMAGLPDSWIRQTVDPRIEWLKQAREAIEVLENQGLTWEWVHDPAIAQAKIRGGKIQTPHTAYEAILVIQPPQMELDAAMNLKELAKKGGSVIMMGDVIAKQPGYFKHAENDEIIHQLLQELRIPESPNTPDDLRDLLNGRPIKQAVRYAQTYPFLRHQVRDLGQYGQLTFFRNQMGRPRFFEIELQGEYESLYWLNPWDGKIYPAIQDEGSKVRGKLEAFGSMFLLAYGGESIPDSLISAGSPFDSPMANSRRAVSFEIEQWDLTIGDDRLANGQYSKMDTTLFEWTSDPQLAYISSPAVYTAHWELADTLGRREYVLDLGPLNGTAEVWVNTQRVGKEILPPYQFDLTKYLVPGSNVVEIWLTQPAFNQMIGLGKLEEPGFEQFDQPNQPLIPMGLKGPVVIWELTP